MRFTTIIVALSLVALASGSAMAEDTPTAGARMAAAAERAGDSADDKAALADQWQEGAKMVAEGNRLVRRSERRMSTHANEASKLQARADRAVADGLKAEASLAEGRRLIAAGGVLKAQAEASFARQPAA